MLLSQMIFVPAALPSINHFHLLPIIVACLLPYILTFNAVRSSSSVITPGNHKRELERYPYDSILYHENQVCRSCQFRKPARSKHCSICDVCVSKSDHHCVWLMNCVGKGNHVYFVGLMGALGVMLSYGSLLAFSILQNTLQVEHSRMSPMHINERSWSKGLSWIEFFDAWTSAISQDIRVGAIGLLASFTAPLSWAMFSYHIYLVWAGMTTNETAKWACWKDDISDGLVYKRSKTQRAGKTISSHWPAWTTHHFHRELDLHERETVDGHRSQKEGWTQVHSIAELENLYDLGFWKNLWDLNPV